MVKVIWQNEHWLVVEKPCEWLTVPSRLGEADARPCLGVELQKEIAGRIWPVHRLDFEVSGIVLFAKTSVGHRAANQWFENRRVCKIYEALGSGPVHLVKGSCETWKVKLIRGKKRSYAAEHGDLAVTEATLCEVYSNGWSFWQLKPITGRSHQLRFEMSRHGVPILGDELYGGSTEWTKPGIALRAVRIDFSAVPDVERFGLPEFLETDALIQVNQLQLS